MTAKEADTIGHGSGTWWRTTTILQAAAAETTVLTPTCPQVPTRTGTAYLPSETPSEANVETAFSEGWANYFAVSAKAAGATSNLPIAQLAANNTTMNGYNIATTGGQGEDNEASVARFLWDLDKTGENPA